MGKFKDMAAKSGFAGIVFDVRTEALKILKVLQEQPITHSMRSNQDDLHAMGYEEAEIGFFLIIIKTHNPGRPAFKVWEGEERAATELLKKLNVQQLNDDYWIATTGCSWSVAKQRYLETDCLGYTAVSFTTPNQLMILAERPD